MPTATVDRRKMIQLVATALLLAPGCSLLNPATEFDDAVNDLSRELNAAADSDAQGRELEALATELVEQARTLSRSHARFTRNFRRDLADRAVSSKELRVAIDAYDQQYRSDLVAMLELQDQLHHSLEPEEWRKVAASLNQTAVRLDNRIMASD